ncbi:MAG: 50S ribosomal protein L28 [Clostridia bacterium]
MSKVCAICSKGQLSGNKVSHSNRKYKKAWGANVQKVKVVKENGAVESMYVCTRCLRSGCVERA